jgi:SAM-dependent methyltransferase
MAGVADERFDLVHSSHCLEHLRDPRKGVQHWFRILKPGGHLVVTVPDEDLYEQGRFPSTFNRDHQWTFTIFKARSWSDRSINLLDLVQELGPRADVQRIQLLDAGYRYTLPRYDQTLTPVAESGIELVVRKRSSEEAEEGGRIRRPGATDRSLRVHLNQYRDDLETLKRSNTERPPFTNDEEL